MPSVDWDGTDWIGLVGMVSGTVGHNDDESLLLLVVSLLVNFSFIIGLMIVCFGAENIAYWP